MGSAAGTAPEEEPQQQEKPNPFFLSGAAPEASPQAKDKINATAESPSKTAENPPKAKISPPVAKILSTAASAATQKTTKPPAKPAASNDNDNQVSHAAATSKSPSSASPAATKTTKSPAKATASNAKQVSPAAATKKASPAQPATQVPKKNTWSRMYPERWKKPVIDLTEAEQPKRKKPKPTTPKKTPAPKPVSTNMPTVTVPPEITQALAAMAPPEVRARMPLSIADLPKRAKPTKKPAAAPPTTPVAAPGEAPDADAKEGSAKKKTPARPRAPKKQDPLTMEFSTMYYELAMYRVRTEHCRVPAGEYPLGAWVTKMRKLYEDVTKKGLEVPYLTMERIKALELLGMNWSWRTDVSNQQWEVNFKILEEYKAEHGHCDAPQNTKLGKWVQHQRLNYRALNLQAQGQPINKGYRPMSKERVDRLTAMGFKWRVLPEGMGWEGRFQQLIEFRRLFGHCHVPQGWKENVPLGRWVMKQVRVDW